MKKTVRIILTVLSLILPLTGKTVQAKDDALILSGRNFSLSLNRSSGAVETICADGQKLTLANRNGLWSTRFIDGSILHAQKISKVTRPDKNKIILHYDTKELAVSVTVTAQEDHVDFQAVLTPHDKTVVEFSIPGRFHFSPEAVNGVICHSNVSTNIGIRFNSGFFRSVQAGKDFIWKKDRVIGEEAVRALFGSPFLNLGDRSREIPLTVTEEAAEWLLPEDIRLLRETRLTPSRPFDAGQAEIAFLKYGDNVVMGGTRFGGSGLFFRTGTFQPSNRSLRNIMRVIVSMIRKRMDKYPGSARKRVALIFLPYGQGAPKPELSEWLAAFRKASIEPELIRSPEELEKLLHSPETAVIVNPGNEFCLPLPGKDLTAMMSDLKRFVRDGGCWFEVSGYSFYYQLGPREYMTTGRNGVPGALADFFHFELNGKKAAVYAVQPVTWEPFEGLRNREAVFVPSVFELGGSGNGGFLDRAFMIYAEKGRSFRTPVTRLRFHEDAFTALKSFASDNGICRKLEEKVPAELLNKVRNAVLFHPPRGRSSERSIRRILPLLPENTIVHISQYLKGGFDKQYPDHLPPAKWWGTMEGFKSLLKEIRERGLLFMPYTNNTWWCDNPRGPTFLQAGEGALQTDLDGRFMKEAYAGNGGWSICMWHPSVRKANETLLRQFTEELPSDILFQDQCGVRKCYSSARQKATGYDMNPASPVPHAVTEGFLSQVRSDARHVPLATEECWWGIIDSEFMICGFSGGICRFMSWQGSIRNKWPEKTWNFFPVLQGLAHDKLLLEHHDLAGDVNTSARIAWTLAFGYNMVSRADPLDPAQLEWLRWIDRIQKSLCSKYAGKGISAFHHEWGENMEPGIIHAVYGGISVTANLRSEPLRKGALMIAPNGFLAQGNGILAGEISACGTLRGTSSFVLDGSSVYLYAEPGTDAFFPLSAKPAKLRHNGRDLKFEFRDGTVVCKLPSEENGRHKRLWKVEIGK